MAKYYESSSTYNFTWDQVCNAFWQRYPNPYSSHVLSEDTISRELRGDGKLYSRRLLTKTNRVPKWGERFFQAKHVAIVEESVIDPHRHELVTYTRNIGFNKIMSVVEKVIYTSIKDNPGKTIAMRSAWVDSQVFGFATAIRAFGVERFKKNCNKTNIGFNYVLHHLFPNSVAATRPQDTSTRTSKEKLQVAAKNAAEQIYQAYSVKT